MNNSRERKLGVVLSYVSIILSILIQIVYIPLLIRRLGQSEYGLYSLVSSIIGYLTIMDFGFGNAIVVFTSKFRSQKKYDEEKKLIGMFNLIFKIIAFFAIFLGFLLYLNVDVFFGKSMTDIEIYKMKIMMLILSFNLFFTFYFQIYTAILNSYEKFVFQRLLSIFHILLKPLLMVPLLFIGFKSISLCFVITFTNLFVMLSNYYYCKRKLKISAKFKGFDKEILKIVLCYSLWIFISIVVDKINWSVDSFILGVISGTTAVSIYSVASTLNSLFINMSNVISGVFLSKISKMVARNSSCDELTNVWIKVGRIQNYIIFLMCSGLILFGKNFIVLWVGKGFEQSYYVLLLLVIPLCIPLIQNLAISIMQAKNKYKFKSILTLIMAIVNIFISIFFVKQWGVIGAALGTCISLVICNVIIMNIYYYKIIKLNVLKFWKEIIKQSIPFIIPIALIITFMFFVKLQSFMAFAVYGSIYIALYCITTYFLCMNEYEKSIIKNVLKKLKLVKLYDQY